MKTLLTKLRRALGFYTTEERFRLVCERAAAHVLDDRIGCCRALFRVFLEYGDLHNYEKVKLKLTQTYQPSADSIVYWWGSTFSEEKQEARCLALLLLAEAHKDLEPNER